MTAVAPSRAGLALALVLSGLAAGSLPAQALGPVPVPKENPQTPQKALLGKALFWDEQLSSDDSMACGTCHRPASGGADPRESRHPGADGEFMTGDDVLGSPGIKKPAASDSILADLVQGGTHVTRRAAPSNLTAQFAAALFWDGRAGGTFVDPLTGAVLIEKGGALETQALVPILSTTEMSRETRTWAAVTGKLAAAKPLALATEVPGDLTGFLGDRGYPALFEQVFGDREITPARIAFALASYQRTLVPDQTPYDRYVAGDRSALTENQIDGLKYFRQFRCAECHAPPLFTDNSFRSIGLRQSHEDEGRGAVTGEAGDAGRFKVPSLRNVGLKPRLMHTGRFPTLTSILRVYRFPNRYPNLDPLLQRGITVNHRAGDKSPMLDFLKNALTDPRVAAETYPFDRPVLRSERPAPRGTPADERR